MDILDRIRENRSARVEMIRQLDTELTELVKQALAEGHSAIELGEILGVSRARVYQIRDGRR
jgi:hypothetical protein